MKCVSGVILRFYEWRCDYDVTIAWMLNALSSLKQVEDEMVILFVNDVLGFGLRYYKSIL